MVVSWRGWGYWVGLLFVFWIFTLIGFAVFVPYYQPDRRLAGLHVQYLFAAMFALHAASVFALVLYRRSRAPFLPGAIVERAPVDPYVDTFIYIRMDWWPYILLAIAVVFALASILGYPLFG
jgi:hypothetical protein